MGRSKVKHELITNEPTRKVTFKKRKAGVLKKLKELTTLCGVLACAIIFGTNNNRPDCWPSPSEVHRVLERLKKLSPTKQGKYMFNQEMFLEKNISKLNEKLKKQRQKNQSLASDLIVAECLAGNHSLNLSCFEKMNDIGDILEEKIRFFTNKIELGKNFNSDEVSPQNNEK